MDIISLKKNKPNIEKSFHDYLENEKTKAKNDMDDLLKNPEYLLYLAKKYGCYDGSFIDDYEFDDTNCIYTSQKNKKTSKKKHNNLPQFFEHETKRRKRGKKNKKRKKQLTDFCNTEKRIYFYNCFDNPDDVEIFNNVYDFDEFLNAEGIEVPKECVDEIMNRDIIHCCVNPDTVSTNGMAELIVDNSYGGLYWQCSENDEMEFANQFYQ